MFSRSVFFINQIFCVIVTINIGTSGVAETESSSHFQYNCSEKQSSDEFPADVFSYEQRIRGAFLLHLFVLIYCFLIVAFICQNYFLPAVFCICFDLKITPDVAAATFMASATSIPEMSMNVIGTFITESDLGIGTIVGSQICNTLGVAGIAGLAATQNSKLQIWPLIRDSFIHICVLMILVLILLDGIVEWSETLVLVILYFVYFFIMLTQKYTISFISKLGNFTRLSLFSSKCKITTHEDKIISVSEFVNDLSNNDNGIHRRNEFENNGRNPNDTKIFHKIWHYFTTPIIKILMFTIPDCKKNRRIYPITFIICVIYIGTCSYIVCWMVTILGNTFKIPDVVMGMVFLAIGGSVPEASSAFINSRNGIGSMSISNTLGANTLDILLSLGVPWFVKCSISAWSSQYDTAAIYLTTENLQ